LLLRPAEKPTGLLSRDAVCACRYRLLGAIWQGQPKIVRWMAILRVRDPYSGNSSASKYLMRSRNDLRDSARADAGVLLQNALQSQPGFSPVPGDQPQTSEP